MLDLLKQLVAIPSIHGNEAALADFVYKRANVHCSYVVKTGDYVLAKVAGKSSVKLTILCGHLDTVAPGSAVSWSFDPHKPIVKNGKLYGLGATDMKAGIATMLQLVRHYATRIPEHDVWFVFVHNEEVDGSGAAAFTQDYGDQMFAYDESCALILEPTPDDGFLYGCKGSLFAEIKVSGGSGHASAPPALSDQAVYKAGRLLPSITDLQTDWQAQFSDAYLGSPTITPTSIIGNSGSPNKLSETCSVVVDIRTTPQIDSQVKGLLDAWVIKQGVYLEYLADHCPSALSSLETNIAVYLINVAGLTPKVSLASSDQVFFTQVGVPTYLLGPGDMAQAHQPNEFVLIAQLQKYFDLYIAILGQR